MNEEAMRNAFEAIIAKDCGDLSTFGTGANMHYRNSCVNAEWIGYKNGYIAATRAAVTAWQPIETAPKDGTSVLLWERWSTNPFVGSFDLGSWSASKEHVDAAGGWDGAVVVDKIDRSILTHWMPLPDAPKEEA